MDLGKLIKFKRLEKKYSQEKLGEMIGVSKMSISKYENNIVDNMSRDKIVKLSQILDIPIIDFITTKNNNEEISEKDFDDEVITILKNIIIEKLSNVDDIKKKEILDQLGWELMSMAKEME